jgi:arginyl-tRNA synthetase
MIPELLHPHLLAAARAAGIPEPVEPLLAAANAAHGDYQWNVALKAAKPLGTNPRALATTLAEHLRAHAGEAVATVEVAGPGFLNLRLDTGWLARTVAAQVASDTLGIAQEGAGRTVVIDYSSPNVAKRMHIGHMRSTQIGNALDRMHRAAGWTVVADNHIGDWGTQFGKLMVCWRNWRDDAAFADDAIGELERLYVLFGEKAKEDPALEDQARAETAKLQRGDPENTALWRMFLDVSMAEFQAVYARMGVRFDEVLGESAYRDRTDAVVADLLARGIAEEDQGAVIVRFGANASIEPATGGTVLIVQKRDGAANYATTDLACVQYRVERWHPERIVYVTDMRQQLHFQQLFALARATGCTADLVHAWFGMLVLPEGAMSTRKGNVIRLVDLMDEAVKRARAVVDEKSPKLTDAERAAIAEAVGVGAVRYADLSQHPQTNVTFEWDRILSMEGNTAPYLMYSHARCATLLSRAEEGADITRMAGPHALERELLLALARTPEAVAAALRSSRPNLLADHLFDVANRVNRVYHDLPVLTGGEDRPHRLALVEASRRVLRHGMGLLGLVALERM